MPDKVSPAQFAATVKAKYPEYKDVDDLKLTNAMINKYPEYKDKVDFGITTAPIAPIVQPPVSKYQKEVDADRSEVGKFISTFYNNAVSSLERLGGAIADIPAQFNIAAPGFAPTEIAKTQEQAKAFIQQPISKRLEPAKQLKQKIAKAADVVRSGYTTREEEKAMAGEFNIMDGIGLNDIKALASMSGGMALDMGLGAMTGGGTFVLQGYNDAVEDYDAATQKAGLQPSEGARGLYGIAGGVINGLLEKFAVDKLVGDTPVFRDIQKKAIANVLKNTAGMTGKKAVDAIETAAVAEIKKLTSDIRSRGVRAAYRTAVEGGTEAVQAALEDGAKLAANLVQGNEAFNEDEIKKGFLQNIVNSGIAGGIMGPIFGAAADKAFGRNVNTQVLKDISEANTPEQLAAINDELTATFDENNFSQEERDAIMANANRYAQIKQTLPEGTNPIAQTIAIPLIENRIKIDNEIQARRSAMENFDEALKSDEEYAISVLEDKKSQINDDIREVVNNEKFDYFEKDGKFYKKLGENAPEEISKNRFDLQQLKTEGYATTTGQGPVQEGGTEGDIGQRQGAQEGRTQKAPPQADTSYRYIVSEEGSEFPVRALVNKKVRKDGRPAILYQEGQRIVARILGTNRIEDVGNVVEMMDALPQDFGIEADETVVTETPTGYRVEGEDMVNDNENPLDAISTDQNGNVKNVVLKTPSGKRRKFRGQAAQDLAYQITLKETLKNEDEFELFLEQEHQAELDAAEAKATAEAETTRANEPVPPVEEPTTEPVTGPTTEPTTGPTVTTEPTYGRFTDRSLFGPAAFLKGYNKLQRKVLKDAKNVLDAINFILRTQGKEASVNLHDQESFEKAVIEAGGSKEDSTSRGFYMTDDGSIHLNMENLASDTMLHEGFHPMLDFLEANNPDAINNLFAQLEKLPGAEGIIAQARANYTGDVTQKKEAITDFVAGVADGRVVINPSTYAKIRKFILDMISKIGIGKGGGTLVDVKNPQGLIKLSEFITEKFTGGDIIFPSDLLNIIKGDKQYDSSEGIDIDETLPEEGVDRGPQFSKATIEAARKNIKSIASLIGTKISRVVFYDLTRVGPLDIKNIKSGYTPTVEGKGGPFYSYMQQRATDKAVLAFVSINQAIQSLQRQILYPNGTHAIASQNPQTAHLGNKSTLAALFGDGVGIFQNAAKTKAQEKEIVDVLVGEIDRLSKMDKGEAPKAVKKILKTLDLASIKTLNDFRDKILLGAGDSFGSRGSIFAALLQGKQTKVTAATRDSHKILHYKYGIPTIADIAEGNNQKELSSAELGDVIKLVRPNTDKVIYTTSQEEFDKYSNKPTPEMKKAGIRIELLPESSAHESYPFILAGENVALLENYISAAQLYKKFEKLPKKQSFFSVGRMKKLAEAGEIPKTVTKEEGAPKFQSQKAPIKWEKSKEGKGDPSISSRNPIVVEAAKNLKSGKITNEEYRATVSANSPVTPITRFFEPATENEISKALSSDKVEKVNAPVDENTIVGLRLDIPAYSNNNTWVVSVHEGATNAGKAVSYRNVARITDVKFGVEPKGALSIATGVPKTTIGRMFGKWKNIDGATMEQQGDNAKTLVQNIVNDPNYVQVGMNPFRHSYFYDRSSDMGRPIVSADEVIQIGGLVYAKNPKYGNWTDEAYRVKGLFDAAGAPVQFQKAPTKPITKGKLGGVKKTFKEQVRYGLLGKESIRLKEKMSGELSAELATAETRVQEAMKTIKKYAGAVTEKDISNFMEGKTSANQLPLDLATQLTKMRAQIDGLTERLIQLGVIDTQESIDYYRENKGKYLLRSYEAINFKENPLMANLQGKGLNIDNVVKKLKNVDQTVVDTALQYLSNRAKAANPSLTDAEAMKIARADANEILSDSEDYVMNKGMTGSTNVKSLRQRKDISPEIRALMGEYTDPLYNYYSTIFKISSITSSRQYLNSLKEFGMGKFFFTEKTEDATVKFAGDESDALAPLNGIYTFPEIKEALKVADKETTGLISQVAGRVRMFKTVYNPATHVKNIIGNMGFAVSNGHWANLPEAYKYMRSAITGKTDEDIMNMMDTLNRYGVLNNVIGIGELKAYFDKNESVDDFLKTIYNNANSSTVASKLGKAKANISKIPKAIEKAYAIEDDVFKILAFVNESNRYSKATFGVNYNKLSADQKKEIDNIASEIVKDTYPTFSRVPKGVKTLSKVAFIGNFLAFPVESVRTQYNSLSLAVKEIKSGNPKLKTVGYTRLGGALAYNSLFASLSMYAYNLAGAGITGAIGMLFGDDEKENETSNAIKKNLAPWNKNSDVYISKFKDGMLEYYDIGSLDSYGYQRRVWNAFWSTKNKGEFDQMMASGVGELLDPWMTKDFVIDNYMKLSSNDNGRGGTIYNPEGKPMDKFTDMSLYVGKQFGPGAVGSAIKVADAYQKGEYEKVMDELGAQVFARRYSVDLNKQFQNYIYTEGTDPKKEVGFRYRLQNAQKIYTDAKRQKLSPLELSEKYDEALDAYKEILLTANEYYKAAALGGTNPKLLIESLKKSRIGSAEAIAIITGSFGKYDQAYIRK